MLIMRDQKLLREVEIWSTLEHDNVLKLHGTIEDPESPLPLLVSEYMINGTAKQFAASSEANIIQMVQK